MSNLFENEEKNSLDIENNSLSENNLNRAQNEDNSIQQEEDKEGTIPLPEKYIKTKRKS